MQISMKKNVIASYASQIFVAVAGIAMLPFYVRYMGLEAYGLVGFFVMLQAWFLLLDLGLSPTMTREMARFRAGAIPAEDVRRLLRTLEFFFATAAIIGGILMVIGSKTIATRWLKVHELPLPEVQMAVALMAPALVLRFCSGLYRGALTGLERIVWLSGFNSLIAAARFILVLPYFIFIGAGPVQFFLFQAAVAVVELGTLCVTTYRGLPKLDDRVTPWSWARLTPVLKFSGMLGLATSLWAVTTQVDKLVLSKLVPLATYAYFSVAVVAAGGITTIAGPIAFALSPRLAHLNAVGDGDGLIRLYRNATQFTSIVVAGATAMLVLFAPELLWVWTGRADVAVNAAPVLSLYAAGNAMLAVSTMVYYLQFAKGNVRLHVVGLILFLAVVLSTLFLAIPRYGIAGAGFAWLGGNSFFLFLWTPVIHRRLAPGIHLRWFLQDITIMFLASGLAGIALRLAVPLPHARLPLLVLLCAEGGILLAVAAAGSSWARQMMRGWYEGLRPRRPAVP